MNQTPPSTVMVCVNLRPGSDRPSCSARGSVAVAEALERGIAERRIDVTLERSICMGQCTKGPTVRFAPGGRFHLGTTLDRVEGVLDELEALCGLRPDDEALPVHLLGS